MRKILIIVLIVLLLVFGYFAIFNGLNIFGLEILSIFQIKDKSEELDSKLQEVSVLTSIDQPKAMAELEDATKQFLIAKEEYNDKILYSSEEEIQEATQGIKYEMEYLWTKVGNHATKNGIVLKFEVVQSGQTEKGDKRYNLNFTATGQYVSISEFIAALENDSSLNFKIENCKVEPFEGNTENLKATFVVKGITIKIDKATNDNQTTSTQNKTDTTDSNQGS